MDTKFENIVPWNGSNDTGRDVRLKWERNFKRIADALKELSDTDKQIIKDILKEIDKIFLHKDKEDGTNYLLKFGEFIDSMVAGKGAGIFPDGRAQFERLEVRDSLTVLELIFNRLSAMESDYSFSESGTIESVSQLEDGTYSLKMKKRWDNDFTALAENDVVYGVVNDLASGGGKYYTSWLRVLHVDISANTINAVMYPDSEVPGGYCSRMKFTIFLSIIVSSMFCSLS